MLARITRTYGGQEGRRVRAGTVFGVGKDHPGLVTITEARYRQLKQQRLAHEITAADLAENPSTKAKPERHAPGVSSPQAKPAPVPANKVLPDSKPPAAAAAPAKASPRTAARRKGQNETPAEPRPLVRQNGGQRGRTASALSSPEDRQAGSLTFKQRGTRGQRAGAPSDGSPSTTPGPSRPGRKSPTVATARGGVASTVASPKLDSGVLD